MEWLNDYNFETRAEAKKTVFEYIKLFYNRKRTHSANGLYSTIHAEGNIIDIIRINEINSDSCCLFY